MTISLKDKIVLITGASSGIGAACAKLFAEQGAKLILAARRTERLAELAKELSANKVHLLTLDVQNHAQVKTQLENLPAEWQAVDILINNAGLARGLDPIAKGEIADWDAMIDTNIKGLLYVTRAIMPGMLERNSGHIINIGSIAGREVYPGGAVYCATKHALHALSKGMKMDCHGTPIRVTEIQPGLVETEYSVVRYAGNQQKADSVYEGMTPLIAEDIADTAVYAATRPLHVDIQEIYVTPVAQSAAHMVHRASKAG